MIRLALWVTAGLVASAGAIAADWPQWRGPNRDGKALETGLLREWPQGGPKQVWKVEGLGEGFASLAVTGGRIYTQGQRGGQQYVIALDEATGRTIWETPNGGTYQNRRGNGPRGTPTLDGDRLYALASNGSLVCLDAATGKLIWREDLLRKYGAGNISWGLSESPLIDGDRVIVNPGGRGSSIIALNKSDGSLIWKSQSDEAGYSSPMVAEIGGVRQYIVLTGEAGVGLLATNGELLWRYNRISNRTANIATPVIAGNHVFLSTDYGTGCALLRLSSTGGGVRAEEVYFNREMKNHYSSSVLIGETLYGYNSSILTAMDLKTGEVKWRDRSVGKGQVIFAEGMLYVFSEDGVAGLVEATPQGYRERSRFEIGRGDYPTWTLPVIANGKLYLRDQGKLIAFDIRAR